MRPVDVLLADGRVAVIRPVRAEDRAALVRLHEGASDDSIRFRFFTGNRNAGLVYVDHLVSGANDVVALMAFQEDRAVGVASAEIVEPGRAEIAFLIDEGAHGLGLGTVLLEHLAAACRDRGVDSFTAEVLGDNHAMIRVFMDAGFETEQSTKEGVVTFSLSTEATSAAVEAADVRECQAETRSLEPLLTPRSVAILGVRRSGEGVGAAVLGAVQAGGFTGDLYVVHPSAEEIGGVKTYPNVLAIGRRIDVIIVAVPADQVLGAVRKAAEAGTRAAVVLSAGFSEMGPEGHRIQREMVAAARTHSMRLIGPNCLGLISNDPSVRLNATFSKGQPPPGGLAVASQSGGVGIALLDECHRTGLGMSFFVSLGNKADVSSNDLLAAWLDDSRVTAAALYLESFGNAQKFARLARRFSERKPLLAVVGGRSEGGRRAGASHTAAAAAPSVGVDALFAQAGVIRCGGVHSLADTARLLTTQPLPAGPRVGIVGNAGGLGVLAADAAQDSGLVVPALSDETGGRISEYVSSTLGVNNPIDLGAGATPGAFIGATKVMLATDEVDAVLLVVAATAVTDASALLDELITLQASHRDKPLLLVVLGDVAVPAGLAEVVAGFSSVEDAMGALGNVSRYVAWRSAPRGRSPETIPGAADRARALAQAALARPSMEAAGGWLDAPDLRALLECYGIDAMPGALVVGPTDAAEAAREIGFPVVAKVADPRVVHRTDRGLVRTSLGSAEEVHQAVEAFEVEMGGTEFPVLIQAQAPRGVEMAVGLVRDPRFGPLVMVAAGGVATDVWSDRVFLMPPITDLDAARAVRSLRSWALLEGHRGAPAVDVAALELLLQSVGRLARDVPEVAELDLNPVIVTPSGLSCVDAKVRLEPATRVLDPGVPRRLRMPD